MGWSDVAAKFVDFLKTPSGFGVFALGLVFAFLIYIIPIGILTGINWYGTDRIVGAIQELKTEFKQRSLSAYVKNQTGGQ